MSTDGPGVPPDQAELDGVPNTDELVFPGYAVQDAIERCYEKGWTDGLPVVPCTEELLAPFLAQTDRNPDEVLLAMPHLNRTCTLRRAAINAVMAGCRPEYFPTVLAAWDAFRAQGIGTSALWQSTTGSAPFLLVNGPVRERIEVNSKANIFGSGFRANATIGRTIRLTAINAFGLRSGVLDQATPGHTGQVRLLHRGERGGQPVAELRRGAWPRPGREHRHGDGHPVLAAH